MSTPTWDPWDPDTLARCEDCGMKLVRVTDEEGLQTHLGHKLHDLDRLTILEFLKIAVGVL